jgi:hypothetical protein
MNPNALVDKLLRRLSSGICKDCDVHISQKGPSIALDGCIRCDKPDSLDKEAVDE